MRRSKAEGVFEKLFGRDAVLVLDCELTGIINQVIWRHIGKRKRANGPAEVLRKCGFAVHHMDYFFEDDFKEIRSLLETDEAAAKDKLFACPESTERDANCLPQKSECLQGLKSRLIFTGFMPEPDACEYSTGGMLYAIFRLPDTNQCTVCFRTCNFDFKI